mmetsp:Transcript_43027/g.132978  ORF Transcript_43027/g.132978 Transcript_43027/m.132978 type:complete len:514 (+) Transcript_43027:2284-3825(+)
MPPRLGHEHARVQRHELGVGRRALAVCGERVGVDRHRVGFGVHDVPHFEVEPQRVVPQGRRRKVPRRPRRRRARRLVDEAVLDQLVVCRRKDEVKVLERLGQHEAVHLVLELHREHVEDGGVPAARARLLERPHEVLCNREEDVVAGGALQEVRRLEELGAKRVPGPGLTIRAFVEEGAEVQVLRHEDVGTHDAQHFFVRVEGLVRLSGDGLQARPEGLQRVDLLLVLLRDRAEIVLDRPGEVPPAVVGVLLDPLVRVEPHLEVLVVVEGDVCLEHVLEEAVDARADVRLRVDPRAREDVDHRAHDLVRRAEAPQTQEGAPRGVQVLAVAGELREQPEFEQEGAGGGGARRVPVGFVDAGAEVDFVKRDGGGGVERRHQLVRDLHGERQQGAVVRERLLAVGAVGRGAQARAVFLRQQMRREQPADDADRRLEHGHFEVRVEAHVAADLANALEELDVVPDERQHVERVDQGHRVPAEDVRPRARHRLQLVLRVRVRHVRAVAVAEHLDDVVT